MPNPTGINQYTRGLAKGSPVRTLFIRDMARQVAQGKTRKQAFNIVGKQALQESAFMAAMTAKMSKGGRGAMLSGKRNSTLTASEIKTKNAYLRSKSLY